MSVASNLRESVRRGLARPVSYFSAEWERLAPKQKQFVTWATVAIVVGIVLIFTTIIFSSVSDLEEGNAEIREALLTIAKNKDVYLEAKSKSVV
jgi:hypothetical protein